MSDVFVAAMVSSLVGVIIGGATSALVVWRPIERQVANIASDVHAIKTVMRGVVDWQEDFDSRERDELARLRAERKSDV